MQVLVIFSLCILFGCPGNVFCRHKKCISSVCSQAGVYGNFMVDIGSNRRIRCRIRL